MKVELTLKKISAAKDTSVIPTLLFSLHAVTSHVMDRRITLSVQRKSYIAIVIKEEQGKCISRIEAVWHSHVFEKEKKNLRYQV